jgi:hypothetical protein
MSFATVSFIARSPLFLLNAARCRRRQVRREGRAATTEFVKAKAGHGGGIPPEVDRDHKRVHLAALRAFQ